MTSLVSTTPISLSQLAAELGGVMLTALPQADGTLITAPDSVTQDTLAAAIAAHVAVNENSNRRTIEDRAGTALATNTTFLALSAPTNAQTLAQVKALTRQNNALIRLALGKFDATD